MTVVRSLTPSVRSGRAFSPLKRLFRLSPREAEFQTRGFAAADPVRREALETAGRAFIGGYNAGLLGRDIDDITGHLAAISPGLRGFAAEGAAMGVAIGDALSLTGARLPAYLDATGRDFTYLVHVGAGWAMARTPWRRRAILRPLDAVHRWLAFDGLGFHDAYFKHQRIAAGWRRETNGYAARAYDQGIGRALWFVAGGDVLQAARLIGALPAARHDDQWSGLGLAMAYAGPAGDTDFAEALRVCGPSATAFAQGVAFACEARARASHVPLGTERAARTVWHRSASDVAGFVRNVRAGLPKADTEHPRYEIWRRDVARAFDTGLPT